MIHNSGMGITFLADSSHGSACTRAFGSIGPKGEKNGNVQGS
jgi:hypothetical protein